MKSRKALNLFLIGFVLVGISIKVKTGIPTAYGKIGSGGLSAFIAYRINEILCGERFSIDLFFNPVGYVLMACGLKALEDKITSAKKLICAALGAMFFSVFQVIMPLSVSSGTILVKAMIVTYVIEGILLLIILTTFVKEAKNKVDIYYHMEVGKDLVFATELFLFAYFALVPAMFAVAIGLFFSKLILVADYVAIIYSVLYFVYKTNKYNNQLKMFE